jgi:uncharacterized cupredoxin-like copper-binding protein
MRWLLVPIALIAGLVTLALPSGGEAGAPAVAVRLAEYTVAVDKTEVNAGTVRFETVNEGKIEHELLVLKTDTPADKLPLGLEGPALKLSGELILGTPHRHEDLADQLRSRHIQPGRARRDTVELAPGRYVLLCNLPGHYESGQRAALVVR